MNLIVGISALFVVFVVPVLTWLELNPNGSHIIAKIKERPGETRRKQRELEQALLLVASTLADQGNLIGQLVGRYSDLSDQILDTAMAADGHVAGYQRITNAKLEGYEGNQTALQEEILALRRVYAELAARIATLEQDLSDVGEGIILEPDRSGVRDDVDGLDGPERPRW
jgi:hypothetical protein